VAGVNFFSQDRFRSLATTFLGYPVPPAAQGLKLKDYAAFANLSYDLTDDVELTLAFRYDEETPQDTTQNRSETFKEWQPKASLSYSFREGLLGYVTIGKGFRAGGFNNLAPGSNFEPGFDKESLVSYEVGLKSSTFGGRLRGGLSLFDIDYTDQQFFLFDQTGTQANINIPKSRIRGGEFELVATPIDSLQLSLGIGFTDSEISEYEDIAGRLDYEHRGKTYWTLDNLDTQPAYNLTNLSFSLEKNKWATRLYVNNLLDEEYIEWFFASRFIGLPADIAWPSSPRQIGVEFSLSY